MGYEQGSFRDRTARVFYRDGRIFRALSQPALTNWTSLSRARFFRDAMAAGRIVRTEESAEPLTPTLARERENPAWAGVAACDISPEAGSAQSEASVWAGFLVHERVPFVSYAYEWPFGMLKDAALLTLDLQLAALEEGFSLKDATPYNVQWRGTAPVFIDIPSFQALAPGEPWSGYRQFCELFLYPLFLLAYRQIPFQPWLRGSIDGITPEQVRNVMSARDYLRPGVLTHVYLHSKLQARYADTRQDVRASLRGAGFGAELIKANIRRLRSIVASLRWRAPQTVWSEYADRNRYDAHDADRKRAFVADVLARRRRSLVWDVGCNTGFFSRIAASHAEYVVAIDADPGVIDRLYRELAAGGPANVLPLAINVTDPSPPLGWRCAERQPLEARGTPELMLCLALLHHLVIGANVPLAEALEWMAALADELVIEFVTRADPMVQTLLRNREDHYADYHQDVFERHLQAHYEIVERVELCGGARIMYYGRRKAGARP